MELSEALMSVGDAALHGWRTNKLGELFEISAGGDFDPQRSSPFPDSIHRYPVYSNALENGGLYAYSSYCHHHGGSITVTARGEIGSANYRAHDFTAIGRVLVLRPKVPVDGFFFAELINSRIVFVLESTGVPQLTAPQIAKYEAFYPPIEEQRAIATALSDVDGLLAGLDALIAKKKALKQGAMQQLLTGKQRLPGFKGEWVVRTFRDLVTHHAGNSTLIKGKLPSTQFAGGFPGFSASGQDVWLESYEHEGEAIVVSAVGSRCGRSFRASGRWSAIANTHVVWPRRDKVDLSFLSLYINDENFWLKSGSGQPFVLVRQSFARELPLPPREEQTAIAEVLSDMDAELAALKARRAKTALLKQGMMQELLTGRTRLV